MSGAQGLPGRGLSTRSPSSPASGRPGPAEAPQIGAYVYSKSRFRADDDTLPVGGVVIDWWDDAPDHLSQTVKLVNIYRGRVEYHVLDWDDLEAGQHGGHINQRVLRSLLVRLAKDEVDHNAPLRHDQARRAIAHALEGAGL